MRRAIGFIGLGLVAVIAVLWLTGGLDGLARALQTAQEATQNRLASAIRALRGGEPGALAAFWAVCFGYGVLHAAGPGHGKLIIGGYGVARRVPMGPLAGLALVSSLAQAAVAVGLVYAAVAVLGLTRQAVEGAADRWMAPASHAMIAGLGLWLVWRGVRGLRAVGGEVEARPVPSHRHGLAHDHAHAHDHGHTHDHGHGRKHDHGHSHDHTHDPDAHCATCGHAHGPTLEQVSRLTGWRDALALVAGIALRPCTGALFVLILTWQLGIGTAGIVGAFVMGLGTALVTVTVAGLAVWAREGALQGLGGGRIARALPVVEMTFGAAIALSALWLLARAI
jgi:ABC-type nickel/cobalt efflux system permease component RcnA